MQRVRGLAEGRIRNDIAGLYFEPDTPLLKTGKKDTDLFDCMCVGSPATAPDKALAFVKEALYECLRQWNVMLEVDKFEYWNVVADNANAKLKLNVHVHKVRSLIRALLKARQRYLARQPERHEHDVSNMTTAAAQLLLENYLPKDPATLSKNVDDLQLMTGADKKAEYDAMVLVGPTRKLSGNAWSLTSKAPQRLHLIGELSAERKDQDLMGFVRQMTTDRPFARSPSSITSVASEPRKPSADEWRPNVDNQTSPTPKAKPQERRASHGDCPARAFSGKLTAPDPGDTQLKVPTPDSPTTTSRFSASVSPNVANRTSPFDTPGEPQVSPSPTAKTLEMEAAGFKPDLRLPKRPVKPMVVKLARSDTVDKIQAMTEASPHPVQTEPPKTTPEFPVAVTTSEDHEMTEASQWPTGISRRKARRAIRASAKGKLSNKQLFAVLWGSPKSGPEDDEMAEASQQPTDMKTWKPKGTVQAAFPGRVTKQQKASKRPTLCRQQWATDWLGIQPERPQPRPN